MIERSQRKVERERKKLAMTDKKYLGEIKKLAKVGQHVFFLGDVLRQPLKSS